MTYLQAVNQACKLAKKNSREYFVVDDGSFSDDYLDFEQVTQGDEQ